MAPDPLAGNVAACRQAAHGLDVELKEIGELLSGENLAPFVVPERRTPDDRILAQRAEILEVAVASDEPGDELAFRGLQLEGGAVELLGLRGREPHEQR